MPNLSLGAFLLALTCLASADVPRQSFTVIEEINAANGRCTTNPRSDQQHPVAGCEPSTRFETHGIYYNRTMVRTARKNFLSSEFCHTL